MRLISRSPESDAQARGFTSCRRSTVAAAIVALVIALALPGAAIADGVSYSYDPLGRLARVTYDNGSSVVYNYDAAGNRTSVVVSGAVTPGVVHGTVSFAGRPTPPDPSWQVLLEVRFFQAGTTTLLMSASPTSDSTGAFTIGSVPPRTYDVQVKFASALSKLLHNVVVAAGDNPTFNAGQLAVGDVNNDDSVDLIDFSLMRATFGRCQGDSGYDRRADLNGDACVDLLDFSLLRTNFGQVGPLETR